MEKDTFSQQGGADYLTPDELGLPARELVSTDDAIEVEQIRGRLVRGFYGT
jgi:hypothetical protein